MKHKVKLSSISVVYSIVILCIYVAALCFMAKRGEVAVVYVLAAGLVVRCLCALYYTPLAISVDDRNLCIHRSLKIKEIPLNEIYSVRLCPPTMAERRICGSGGLFGYWGWFGERDLGKYFAYYGKSSDCFLVTLKNGRKYMLGCENPEEIVGYISRMTI